MRLSPGAANSESPSTLESYETPVLVNVAAPGDGRTPAQVRFGGGGTFHMPPARAAAAGFF